MARRLTRRLLAIAFACALATPATAQNLSLLIQSVPGGAYRIWHGDGTSMLDDDDVAKLDAIAVPEGSPPLRTSLGPAIARRTSLGVIIELPEAASDRHLLVDRDGCGHLKTWHADGAIVLSDDQATDLVMSALPGGGPRVVLDAEYNAKAYITSIGVMVAVWKPRRKER